jgi:Holliday junction DNA helicase RuvA
MIEYISGIIIKKNTNNVIVDINGLGYKVNISLNTYDSLPDLNKHVSLDTYFSVSENSQDLYGFHDILEKDLFIMLISVSGIGPKTAISLLSAVKPGEFKSRLIAGEVKMLTDLPGIGPKTARRIIVELKDKFIKSNEDDLPIEDSDNNSDAYFALISLGFQSNKVKNIIRKIQKNNIDISTEDLIKDSLKKLR